jgi:hypothetical protein
MFIAFSDKESSYIYKANNIASVQHINGENFFVIQFDSGMVQEYLYDRMEECLETFLHIREQLGAYYER